MNKSLTSHAVNSVIVTVEPNTVKLSAEVWENPDKGLHWDGTPYVEGWGHKSDARLQHIDIAVPLCDVDRTGN